MDVCSASGPSLLGVWSELDANSYWHLSPVSFHLSNLSISRPSRDASGIHCSRRTDQGPMAKMSFLQCTAWLAPLTHPPQIAQCAQLCAALVEARPAAASTIATRAGAQLGQASEDNSASQIPKD